ncbi:MAG: outer membrane lipopolysaccharide assembly protein LptE/RlpB [Kiritimatiellia bacterium]|jgi:outer membrane lipopolysaccharide assembly protein LptE/RlpB
MKHLTYFIAITLTLSLLSACGWRLRGSDDSMSIQQAIYLEVASGKVYQRISQILTRKQLFVDIATAEIQLVLGEEYFERRSSTVNNLAQTTQYKITLSVPYEIFDASSQPLIKKTTAELTRYYTFNQNAITSSDKEEQALRKEMVRQVARQILQRVTFLGRK